MKKLIVICFVTTVIILINFYETTIIINEIFNGIINSTEMHNNYNYSIKKINIFDSRYIIKEHLKINTEYITQNYKSHTVVKTIIVSLSVISMITLVLKEKIQIIFYAHEQRKLSKAIISIVFCVMITFIYFNEILNTIIIKKNINYTEILYNTQWQYNNQTIMLVILTTLLYIYYYTKTYYINKELKNKYNTKTIIWTVIILVTISTAQYSIYETMLMITIIEIMQQITNLHKSKKNSYKKYATQKII